MLNIESFRDDVPAGTIPSGDLSSAISVIKLLEFYS